VEFYADLLLYERGSGLWYQNDSGAAVTVDDLIY
jgi:hypothetical protein